MNEIELPELPKSSYPVRGIAEIGDGEIFDSEDMVEYARAAVEADRAKHFKEHLQKCSDEVATWPEWKKQYNYERMFMAACEDLGDIHDALGLDPDDAEGAGPIIEAIEEIKAQLAQADAQASVPEGWKLVPVAPTEWQLTCGLDHMHYGRGLEGRLQAKAVYDAIVNAAPEHPDYAAPDSEKGGS